MSHGFRNLRSDHQQDEAGQREGRKRHLPELDEAPPRASPSPDSSSRSSDVRNDGRVQPDRTLMGEDRAILGDLTHTEVLGVWRSEPYEAFRVALFETGPLEDCRGRSR